ncbi:hypothetical protein [Herpetosiphon geysericola]|uniref:Uncharacterized protein n=1 Tax=Herpetosiphon geysericola TaxID=70996 RepID=A0A0P6YRB7_9CHLR|nr:hypothetical protein [Herpetosiphon geysericola]KPL85744.1 hypothetical protein SE18_15530 [Herpetosiphon geysericola]
MIFKKSKELAGNREGREEREDEHWGTSINRNNPQHKHLGVLGDENPRRFPPAEGRTGGETNVKQSAINKNETAKIFSHELPA